MSRSRFSMLAAVVALGFCAPNGARAEEPPTQTTISGKAYEGEHLALVDSSAPLYTLTLTTKKGSGVDH